MIYERECQFTENEINKLENFPRYLIVRSPLEGNEDNEEW
jgi:hypothetical protein